VSAPLKVALDVTPLLGPRTGVGEFCAGAIAALSAPPARALVSPRAFAVTWRRRDRLAGQVPGEVPVAGRPMPARPVQWAWRRFDFPVVEWWAGPVDVVHGTNFVVPPARRAARVATVHDLTAVRYPELCEPVSRAFPVLVRRALAEGAFVHTPSAFVAEEVVELLGADPDRVRAVHHGVPTTRPTDPAPTDPAPTDPAPTEPALTDPALTDPAPDEPGRDHPGGREADDDPGLPPEVGPYVLALGTIEPRKDHPGLVRAFDLLAATHPELALVLAGPDGWGTQALESAIAGSGFARRIVRLGYVSSARRAALLAHAAVFAYPSLYEGFGFPPLEAMSAGVPVVTTDAGALPEVVGEAALIVPAGQAERLAGALETAIYDERVRAALVGKGRCRAASFRWDDCAAGLATLYRDAAEARG
jgi:glycosyltransferase involved in cell wall biosynthesis